MMVSPYAYVGMRMLRRRNENLNSAFQLKRAYDIIDYVCKYCGVPKEDVLKYGRKRPAVDVRHICAFFIRKKTALSLKQIGEIFGGKDHTSILNSIKQVNTFLSSKEDTDIKDIINHLIILIE